MLVLQECLGWDDGERLAPGRRRAGPPGHRPPTRLGTARPRGSGSCYHVSVVSRLPLRSLRVHANPHFIGHCLLQCELETGADR